MSPFIVVNWAFCLTTSLLLIGAVWRWRFLLVKPSIWVLLFFHVIIQWTATVEARVVEGFLPRPWPFALLAQGFPLIGVGVSMWVGRRSARMLWYRLRHPQMVPPWARTRAIRFLGGCCVLIVGLYLATVPLQSTGLYAILVNPAASTLAREYSLKLLNNTPVRYGYSFLVFVFAPLLAALLVERLIQSLERRCLTRGLQAGAALLGLLVAVSLTGARSFAVITLLTAAVTWYVRKGLPFNPLYIVPAILAILILPAALTILREGRELDLPTLVFYLRILILERVFYAPMETGMWFAHYAQTHGFFGMAAIPKLAALVGVESINVPNLIGLTYTNWGYASINANTGYVFAYYSYFGLISLPFSLLGLWLLDIALWVYRHIGDNLLLACVASVSVVSVGFISIEYTTMWLSGGLGPLLLVSLTLDRIARRRIKIAPS